jgi:poly-gamma-glutamate synthesis protein (capsule biosynthesis protein)
MTELRVAAVGDISFNDRDGDRPSLDVLSAVTPIFHGSDLVIANLESPLLWEGTSVPGKCVLRGSPEWAGVLRAAGVHVVSLANNHTMDFGTAGLDSTVHALDAAGIRHVGAGRNRREANAPLIVECRGLRVAVLARTSVTVSSPSYATNDGSGTAYLDVQETIDGIRHCSKETDIVVLAIHWGLEDYDYPSVHQRVLARRFLSAGAHLILGHHPHVLQGIETVNTGLACYSLGNLVFRDVSWSYRGSDGARRNDVTALRPAHRRAGVLTVPLFRRAAGRSEFRPTYLDRQEHVRLDEAPERLAHWARLSSRLHIPLYPTFWRLYSLNREWNLRLAPRLAGAVSLSRIRRVRPRHVRELGMRLRRSARIASEKTTNPYE